MSTAYLSLETHEGGFCGDVGRITVRLHRGEVGITRRISDVDLISIEGAGHDDYHAASGDHIVRHVHASDGHGGVITSIAVIT